MSVHFSSEEYLKQNPPPAKLAFGHPASPSTHCFICGKPLGEGYSVGWIGHAPAAGACNIHMHPRCATEFAFRLVRDLHQFELASGTEVSFVKREPRA